MNIELVESPEFKSFCQTMYTENCVERRTWNEEPYPSVEDYVVATKEFLMKEFLKNLKNYVRE